MTKYRTEAIPSIDAVIRDIGKRLSALERTPQASNTAVNTGVISIIGGALEVRRDPIGEQGALIFGSNTTVNGEAGMTFQLTRSQTVPSEVFNGETAMIFATVEGQPSDVLFPTWTMFDKSGDALISDSDNGRRGFSDPRLSTTWWDPLGGKTTASGTFGDLAQTLWYQYHPNLRIRVITVNPASTTSEIQVIDLSNGNNVLASATGPANTSAFVDLIIARSETFSGDSPNGNEQFLGVQHRRASGAGTCTTIVAEMIGIDLSWFEAF